MLQRRAQRQQDRAGDRGGGVGDGDAQPFTATTTAAAAAAASAVTKGHAAPGARRGDAPKRPRRMVSDSGLKGARLACVRVDDLRSWTGEILATTQQQQQQQMSGHGDGASEASDGSEALGPVGRMTSSGFDGTGCTSAWLSHGGIVLARKTHRRNARRTACWCTGGAAIGEPWSRRTRRCGGVRHKVCCPERAPHALGLWPVRRNRRRRQEGDIHKDSASDSC